METKDNDERVEAVDPTTNVNPTVLSAKRIALNAKIMALMPEFLQDTAILAEEFSRLRQADAAPRTTPCQSFLSSVSTYGLWAASGVAAAASRAVDCFSSKKTKP